MLSSKKKWQFFVFFLQTAVGDCHFFPWTFFYRHHPPTHTHTTGLGNLISWFIWKWDQKSVSANTEMGPKVSERQHRNGTKSQWAPTPKCDQKLVSANTEVGPKVSEHQHRNGTYSQWSPTPKSDQKSVSANTEMWPKVSERQHRNGTKSQWASTPKWDQKSVSTKFVKVAIFHYFCKLLTTLTIPTGEDVFSSVTHPHTAPPSPPRTHSGGGWWCEFLT
jgi:hypothetical protein